MPEGSTPSHFKRAAVLRSAGDVTELQHWIDPVVHSPLTDAMATVTTTKARKADETTRDLGNMASGNFL